MIPVSGETYVFKLYSRKPNSDYKYEENPKFFNGRPAGKIEKKSYRMQKGVEAGEDSLYILSTHLPLDINDKDKVEFLGKLWTVQSIGYYLKENLIVNASLFDEEYIIKRCPKGVVLG